jgi:hypothetical protein
MSCLISTVLSQNFQISSHKTTTCLPPCSILLHTQTTHQLHALIFTTTGIHNWPRHRNWALPVIHERPLLLVSSPTTNNSHIHPTLSPPSTHTAHTLFVNAENGHHDHFFKHPTQSRHQRNMRDNNTHVPSNNGMSPYQLLHTNSFKTHITHLHSHLMALPCHTSFVLKWTHKSLLHQPIASITDITHYCPSVVP